MAIANVINECEVLSHAAEFIVRGGLDDEDLLCDFAQRTLGNYVNMSWYMQGGKQNDKVSDLSQSKL